MRLGFRPGYAAVSGETKLRFGRGTGAESLAAKTERGSDGRVGRRLGWGMGGMLQYQWATRRRRRPNRRGAGLARTPAAFAFMMAASGLLKIDTPELSLDIPESYRAAHGAPEAATPALDWWHSFKSREVTSLVEQAITANFDIAVAIAQIVQADAQVRIAGAPLLPTLDYNASDTASKASEQLRGGGGGSPFARAYATSLSASYVIDFWGKNRAALNAAAETAVASRYNREGVTLTAITTVADTYFQILAAQDRLGLAPLRRPR